MEGSSNCISSCACRLLRGRLCPAARLWRFGLKVGAVSRLFLPLAPALTRRHLHEAFCPLTHHIFGGVKLSEAHVSLTRLTTVLSVPFTSIEHSFVHRKPLPLRPNRASDNHLIGVINFIFWGASLSSEEQQTQILLDSHTSSVTILGLGLSEPCLVRSLRPSAVLTDSAKRFGSSFDPGPQ